MEIPVDLLRDSNLRQVNSSDTELIVVAMHDHEATSARTQSPAVSCVHETRLLDILQPLIRIRSENPPGNEHQAAHFVGDVLSRIGFEVVYYEAAPSRTNVVATLKGSGGGRSLILNGHLDTGLLGSGWKRDPLGGEVDEGRIYGRGAGDMKTGIAAMVEAARAVVESGVNRKGDLIITAVADETSGSRLGMQYLVDAVRLRSDMAVVCEPTGPAIGIAQRGAIWARVDIRGKSGQAARPWTGVNAISIATRVIDMLETWHGSGAMYRQHPLLPPPTLNIATVSGGIKPNVIPDQCSFELDRRLLPEESADDILAQIRQIAESIAKQFGASVAVQELMRAEASQIAPESAVVEQCQRAFNLITGQGVGLRGIGGFTDARFFIHGWRIPAVIFGPWYLTTADRSISDIPDEYAILSHAVTGTKVYAQLIADVVG